MPCTINQRGNQIQLENMWDAGIIFGQKASEGLLSKYGGSKNCKWRFMPVDVKVKESDVTMLFLFLGKRYGCGLVIKEC